MRTLTNLPRMVKAELVEIGDLVSVEVSTKQGVSHYRRGRVAERVDHGDVRQMRTAEGGILFAWTPGKNTGITITLIERQPAAQTSLFDDELMNRLAG